MRTRNNADRGNPRKGGYVVNEFSIVAIYRQLKYPQKKPVVDLEARNRGLSSVLTSDFHKEYSDQEA